MLLKTRFKAYKSVLGMSTKRRCKELEGEGTLASNLGSRTFSTCTLYPSLNGFSV